MKKAVRVIANVLFWVFFIFAISYTVSNVIQLHMGIKHPMFFGYTTAVVETGSMEPAITPGTFVVIKECKEYKVDDVVVYINEQGTSISHRIVGIDGDLVTTKGDANDVEDTPFNRNVIVGKIVYQLPGLGKFIRSAFYPILMLILVVLVIISAVTGKSDKSKNGGNYSAEVDLNTSKEETFNDESNENETEKGKY